MRTETRPWGYFTVLSEGQYFWLKELVVAPGQSLSLQYHDKRRETWVAPERGLRAVVGARDFELEPGIAVQIPRRVQHRLYNPCARPLRLIEWADGFPVESDIVRLSDRYGR